VLSMDFDNRDYAKYRLIHGDILLNEGQSRELVGRCAMYSGQISDCCFQNTLLRFRSGPDLLPEFSLLYFQFLFYRGTFSSVATQTTSIAHLGSDTLKKLYMPIPPRDDQEAIVKKLFAMKESRGLLKANTADLLATRSALINTLGKEGAYV
ncbi:MAG: restriction endonuclease subunit S, partial [Planctomycetota bacterium]